MMMCIKTKNYTAPRNRENHREIGKGRDQGSTEKDKCPLHTEQTRDWGNDLHPAVRVQRPRERDAPSHCMGMVEGVHPVKGSLAVTVQSPNAPPPQGTAVVAH